MKNFDIAIIGAGPAGYVAAIEAGKSGLKTIIIDMGKIGGACLNYGCIPTKTFYYFANIFYKLKKFEKLNILEYKLNYDWKNILKYKKEVINKLIKGIEYLFKKNNVTFVSGKADLIDKNNIVIDNKTRIYADKIIIATGSKDIIPDVFKNIKFYTTENFWNNETKPEKLIIIGAGIIGIEIASILSQFDIEIILLEKADEILPNKNNKIIKTVKKFLKKNNIKIYTDINIINVNQINDTIYIELNDGQTIAGNDLLIATGRKPNITINTKKIGIELKDGFIKVNENYTTSVVNIFAIGDVINKNKMFAHLASFQAIQVIKYITGKQFVKFNNYSVPSTIFTFPQISEIKINYEQINSKISKSYIGNSMGKIENLIDGFFDIEIKNNIPANVTIASEYANEIINFYSFMVNNSLSMKYLKNSIFTHPSESEIILD